VRHLQPSSWVTSDEVSTGRNQKREFLESELISNHFVERFKGWALEANEACWCRMTQTERRFSSTSVIRPSWLFGVASVQVCREYRAVTQAKRPKTFACGSLNSSWKPSGDVKRRCISVLKGPQPENSWDSQ